jgi:hypothetical protein
MASYWLRQRNAIRLLPYAPPMYDSVTIGLKGLGENEIRRWFYISFFSSAKSSACVLVNLSVRRTMGKNWLRSAMTISGTFRVQPGRGAQPQVSGNGPR